MVVREAKTKSLTRALLEKKKRAIEKMLSGPPNVAAVIPIHTLSEMNMRQHYGTKSVRTKSHRNTVRICVGMQLLKFRHTPRPTSDLMVILMERHSPRMLDGDNLGGALKAVRDGTADALGLKDDRERDDLDWECAQEQSKSHEVVVSIWF